MVFWKRWIVKTAIFFVGKSAESDSLVSMDLLDRCKNMESVVSGLRAELSRAIEEAKKDRDDYEHKISVYESRLKVHKVEIKELVAVITRLHAIKERETAIEVMKTDFATKGGLPHHVRVPD